MRIISDIKSENEIKDTYNEKKKKKLWNQDGPFTYFIIVFRFGSHQCLDYYTKRLLK